MKIEKKTSKSPSQLKSKLVGALAMLLVATIMMGSTSYAWLVLSIAPEVTGIDTNIGANGSLEIALLNTETRSNMNAISSGKVGDSLAANNANANNTWGNLVDLNAASYGLDDIILMPARIDAVPNSDGTGYTVTSGMLSVPTYGYDGRVVDVTEDTVSAVYSAQKKFTFVPASQDYGVRAIGTADNLSVQGAALATAKGNVVTYTNGAANAAAAALDDNGSALFSEIMAAHVLYPNNPYDDADLAILTAMIDDLQESLDNIELALRNGLIVVAASEIEDEDAFIAARDQISDQSKELSELLGSVSGVPAAFEGWVTKLNDTQNSLNLATIAASALEGGSYS